jgi:phenylpropionate dioxygenase-like ring-hydroxylating dioxygenase large terminal subunit
VGEIARGQHFYQQLLDEETRPVPASLRAASVGHTEPAAVAPSRYFDPEFHRLEVERVWGRVWQMACREEQIAEVGDSLVYEIADWSLIVVRTAPDEVRAYHNSCLHRGTQLRSDPGNVTSFRCPFHGFTWNLDGTLHEIPCAWDFPQIDPATFCLPEARVGTWGGFVFVNVDPQAPPLEEYLEDLPWHFAPWPLEERYLAAHTVRVMPCNWKVALEAFIEAYHTIAVHPQLLPTVADSLTEYDIYGAHVSRMITRSGSAANTSIARSTISRSSERCSGRRVPKSPSNRDRTRAGCSAIESARRYDGAPAVTTPQRPTPSSSMGSSTSSSPTSCRGRASSPRSSTASVRTVTTRTRASSTS